MVCSSKSFNDNFHISNYPKLLPNASLRATDGGGGGLMKTCSLTILDLDLSGGRGTPVGLGVDGGAGERVLHATPT